jgi:hypothetical protein
VVNTIIGGSAGGIVVLFYNKFVLKKKWSYLMSINGALTGKMLCNIACLVKVTTHKLLTKTLKMI